MIMKREKWLDIARGIVMIMVVLGHTGSFLIGKGFGGKSMSMYFMLTSAIKIPGFFAISGYLFNDKGGNVIKFLKNKIIKILVPYFSLGAINMFLNILITWKHVGKWSPGMTEYVYKYVTKFFLGKNLWFIPCLFSVEILFFIVKKITKSNLSLMGILCAILCVAGYMWSVPEVYRPWRIDTALMCIWFVYIGYFIKNSFKVKEFVLSKKAVILFAIMYSLLCVISYIKFGLSNLDINRAVFYSFKLCMVMILVGIIMLFSIGKLIDSNKILEFIGQNTLAYFILHTFFFKFTIFVLGRMSILNLIKNTFLNATVVTAIAMIIMVPVLLIINRYFPIMVGKNRRQVK